MKVLEKNFFQTIFYLRICNYEFHRGREGFNSFPQEGVLCGADSNHHHVKLKPALMKLADDVSVLTQTPRHTFPPRNPQLLS